MQSTSPRLHEGGGSSFKTDDREDDTNVPSNASPTTAKGPAPNVELQGEDVEAMTSSRRPITTASAKHQPQVVVTTPDRDENQDLDTKLSEHQVDAVDKVGR